MKPMFLFLSILIGNLCVGNLWAQHPFTTDDRHFTVTPQPATESNSNQLTAETNQIPAEAKKPVVLNFDYLPMSPWVPYNCSPPSATATASHGILTIDSPASACYEYDLWYPEGIWHKYVSNKRGWVVETSLQIDPSTMDINFDGAVRVWIHDHTNLLIVGFNTTEIFLAYPEHVSFPMNTTDSFHIYRIEAKEKRVWVYVDGHLAIDHTLSTIGAGSNDLMFGDGSAYLGRSSLTRWDYFSYEVFPHPALRE